MGSRDQKSSSSTQYTGSWQAPPTTPQIEKLDAWEPDKALLDSAITSDYSTAKRNLVESTGGYSGTNNPYAQAREREIGMRELSDHQASALADADRQRNLVKLGQLDSSARLTAPQYIQTGASTQGVQSAPPLLTSIISGGLGIAASF